MFPGPVAGAGSPERKRLTLNARCCAAPTVSCSARPLFHVDQSTRGSKQPYAGTSNRMRPANQPAAISSAAVRPCRSPLQSAPICHRSDTGVLLRSFNRRCGACDFRASDNSRRIRLPSEHGIGRRFDNPRTRLAIAHDGQSCQNTSASRRLINGPAALTIAFAYGVPCSRTMYGPRQFTPARLTRIPSPRAARMCAASWATRLTAQPNQYPVPMIMVPSIRRYRRKARFTRLTKVSNQRLGINCPAFSLGSTRVPLPSRGAKYMFFKTN